MFPEQGSNLCVLHWQVDSLPLSPQGSQEFGSYLCISGSSCFNRTAAECPAASERSAVKLICRMRISPSHPHWHQLPRLHLYKHFIDFYATVFFGTSFIVGILFIFKTDAGCGLLSNSRNKTDTWRKNAHTAHPHLVWPTLLSWWGWQLLPLKAFQITLPQCLIYTLNSHSLCFVSCVIA